MAGSKHSGAKRSKQKGRRVGARRKTGFKTWLKRIVFTFLGLGLLGVIVGCLGFIIAYVKTDVPSPQKFAQAEISTVYYGNNKDVMGTFSEQDRVIIDATELPNYIGQAVVASEDRTFYENNGVDLKGIARALINNLQGKATQGGSTLSQQYVENYYMGSTKTYVGKAKEAILALKINREQSKDTILNNYLNTIYFGRQAYGIQAASKAYFNKDAKDLTVSEAALLAGIIPAPSAWDPQVDPDTAEQRWNRVLNNMVADGWIKAAERKKLEYPKAIDYVQKSSDFKGTRGYLLQHVRDELVHTIGYSEEQVDILGLKVYTTIDPEKQQLMEKVVANMPKSPSPGLKVAMSSIDTATGGIIAEYGGPDYQKIQQNAATQDIAMAGSTFKSFVVMAALEKGWSIEDKIDGSAPMVIDGHSISNSDGSSKSVTTLREALMHSWNTPFVRLNMDIGPESSKNAAIRAGLPDDTNGLDSLVPVSALGFSSPHNIDITEAYATFATGGIHREAHIVAKVTDKDGNVLYEADTDGTRVFTKQNTTQLVSALQDVQRSGISSVNSAMIGRPIAYKTGTSENSMSAQFAGFIPQVATAVSLYQAGKNGEQEPITPFGGYSMMYGGAVPGDMWGEYMRQAVADLPVEQFPTYTKGNNAGGTSGNGPQTKDPEYSSPTISTVTPYKTRDTQPVVTTDGSADGSDDDSASPSATPAEPSATSPSAQ